MKKFIIFAVVFALLVPTLAFAATEFSLGGFVKLDAFWDSTQAAKNMNGNWTRNNVGFGTHGRTKFTAQGSRFSFTIKGPDLWGAKTSGFIEMDFDSNERPQLGVNTASNSYTPRLRHAMFRFNWPETELLFGQYWSMLCEWYPELAEDGPFQATGMPTARMAQIRLTQQFLGWGTASFMIGEPNDVNNGQPYLTGNSGEQTTVPQVQGKLMYAQDLWGKAAYYGKPIPFTVSLVGAWQQSWFAQGATAMKTWQNGSYSAALANTFVTNHQALNPYMVQASVFVPVIPTTSANLAGTASILASWYVGQGLEAFGMAGAGNFYKFSTNSGGTNFYYDAELQRRFGGLVQGQYYFNNQWFLTAAYGLSQEFGADLESRSPGARQATFNINPQGFKYALANAADLTRTFQQAEVCLWYRPIQAIKFGLEYAYGAQNWFQSTTGAQAATNVNFVQGQNNSSLGNAHRVEFVGFFYF